MIARNRIWLTTLQALFCRCYEFGFGLLAARRARLTANPCGCPPARAGDLGGPAYTPRDTHRPRPSTASSPSMGMGSCSWTPDVRLRVLSALLANAGLARTVRLAPRAVWDQARHVHGAVRPTARPHTGRARRIRGRALPARRPLLLDAAAVGARLPCWAEERRLAVRGGPLPLITTVEFLRHLGLGSLADLPPAPSMSAAPWSAATTGARARCGDDRVALYRAS
jgi:hypothetical protein